MTKIFQCKVFTNFDIRSAKETRILPWNTCQFLNTTSPQRSLPSFKSCSLLNHKLDEKWARNCRAKLGRIYNIFSWKQHIYHQWHLLSHCSHMASHDGTMCQPQNLPHGPLSFHSFSNLLLVIFWLIQTLIFANELCKPLDFDILDPTVWSEFQVELPTIM